MLVLDQIPPTCPPPADTGGDLPGICRLSDLLLTVKILMSLKKLITHTIVSVISSQFATSFDESTLANAAFGAFRCRTTLPTLPEPWRDTDIALQEPLTLNYVDCIAW